MGLTPHPAALRASGLVLEVFLARLFPTLSFNPVLSSKGFTHPASISSSHHPKGDGERAGRSLGGGFEVMPER